MCLPVDMTSLWTRFVMMRRPWLSGRVVNEMLIGLFV